MELYYNKDRDKTVAVIDGAPTSVRGNLKFRGYKYICTVSQLGKDVIDLGTGIGKEASEWFDKEPLTLEAMVRSLNNKVKRLERLADENGWDKGRRTMPEPQTTQEENMDMTREDGYVYHLSREQLYAIEKEKGSEVMTAIQLLQSGLSYINYAKNGSTMGTIDPEQDYKFGMDFVYEALSVLRGGVTPVKRKK